MAGAWQSPNIQLTWGPYFRPEPDEQTALVNLAVAALGGQGGEPLVTRELAIKKVASIFGIDNVNNLIETLDKERDAKAQQRQDQADDQHRKSLEKIKAGGQNPALPFGNQPPKTEPPENKQ